MWPPRPRPDRPYSPAPWPLGAPLRALGEFTDAVLPLGGEHDRGARARDALGGGQASDGPLQSVDVGDTDLEHERVVAGDEPAVLDLVEVPKAPGHVLVVGGVAELHPDQGGGAEAEGGGLHGGAIAG